ncbi:MAG: calcium-binding protein [Aestuariivirga sp.]
MAILTVSETTDFRPQNLDFGVDLVQFTNATGTTQAIFSPSQIGLMWSGISRPVQGSSGINEFIVQLEALGSTQFALLGGITFSNWVTGIDRVVVNGSSDDDVIDDSEVDDILSGGLGNDNITGRRGVNTISGDDGDDLVATERSLAFVDGGSGTDTLFIARDYTSPTFLVDLIIDIRDGGGGRDIGDGTTLRNVESIRGASGLGNDTIFGGDLNDNLSGGLGDDKLFCGGGNDGASGEDGADFISGDAGIDILQGGDGNDKLFGGADRDTVDGGFGDDIHDGGGGRDTMRGGTGNDSYYVDIEDFVSERSGEGFDTFYSKVDITLASNIERLLLLGSAISGTGNALSNIIYGTSDANVLNGVAGADRLLGGGGDDNYIVDSTGDRVFETLAGAAGGTDQVNSLVNHTLSANVEELMLTGSGNWNGTGNDLANSITGNTGNNYIDGKDGADSMAGNAGLDNFLFTTALGSGNVDFIHDFTPSDDTLRLDDAIFAGLATGYLAVAAFHIGAVAADAGDRIIYDSATGNVYFDADGAGGAAQVQFARLAAGLALTNADIYVY